ncbi:MAG: hypothetical protein AAF629_13605 [Chloroflexota bacterium]
MINLLKNKRIIRLLGLSLILVGIFANPTTLTALLSTDGLLDPRSVVIIWVFDLLMIVSGLILMIAGTLARLIDLAVGLIITIAMIYGAERLFHRLNNPPPNPNAVAGPPPPAVIHEGDYAADFFRDEPLLGYRPKPNVQVTSIKKLGDELVYDVVYTIDDSQRRHTPVDTPTGRDQFALFFGGSFVFGEGVNDDETLPYYFGALATDYQPYNYGLSGYGPQQMLAKLQSNELEAELAQPNGMIIYTFIDAHVERAIGSMYVYNAWGDQMPYYTTDWSGNLIRQRDFRTGRPATSKMFEWLEQSEIARYYNINVPNVLQDRHYAHAVRIIAAARDTFQEKYDSNQFYVMIYPDEGDYFEDMEAHLMAADLQLLNYDERMKLDKEAGLAIKGDGHPTAQAHEIVAQWLVEDLELGASNTP